MPLVDRELVRLGPEDLKSCCVSVYEHPAVRWLLGGELHPGGEEATRRALEMIGLSPGDRLLDVASGTGASALLAARELETSVTGIDYGEQAVLAATAAAGAEGLDQLVEFIRGDAEALPLPDGSFDAVLCECSLCTFPDKARAASELRRVLRPGGRLALCDVVVEHSRVGADLRGPFAVLACVGAALPRAGYERLLADAGLPVLAVESRDQDAALLARRVHDRLRGARLLGVERLAGAPLATTEAIEVVAHAREAIRSGALGYAIFIAGD
jgi:SAM-dependent methyltransferase